MENTEVQTETTPEVNAVPEVVEAVDSDVSVVVNGKKVPTRRTAKKVAVVDSEKKVSKNKKATSTKKVRSDKKVVSEKKVSQVSSTTGRRMHSTKRSITVSLMENDEKVERRFSNVQLLEHLNSNSTIKFNQLVVGKKDGAVNAAIFYISDSSDIENAVSFLKNALQSNNFVDSIQVRVKRKYVHRTPSEAEVVATEDVETPEVHEVHAEAA